MMDPYLSRRKIPVLPRLPLQGHIDLTYHCNNTCLHCWSRRPLNVSEGAGELSFDEIRHIADQARAMGCRCWNISGGEPMLRPDFAEIFDYLTCKSTSYTLNSNGTFITPSIARLLKRKGTKMIALYGATEEVYDAVTRHPGGFEQAMRGFAYLREAGARFIVQLIPMRANWHQWNQMIDLAQSLSPHYRVGAAWLYLSADGTTRRNAEIAAQRLSPRDVIELDKPDPAYWERIREVSTGDESCDDICGAISNDDDRLFAKCIAGRRNFHIDAYGGMTFCCFIKDPSLRYNLRSGTFREAWDVFIPSLADKVRGGEEWDANCGSCEKRADCRWCPVYSYLERGRYSARIPYLCAVAEEARQFKTEWQEKHRRYFRIAGVTVRVETDLNLDQVSFKPELRSFAVDGSDEDNVTIRHYFELPDLQGKDLGTEVHRKAPWAISRKGEAWYYLGISPNASDPTLHRVAVCNSDHTHITIYNTPRDEARIRESGFESLSLFPTDQIWLAPVLADRQACILHSAGVILNGQGLVFVGHSDAGKSTTATMLKGSAEILCDDRIIVRRWKNGFRVHGTWSHGDVPDVSPASAPLRAVLFLHQDTRNEIVPLDDKKEIWKRLLATLIKPAVTSEWWQKELDVLEQIVNQVPCYTMHFDKSSEIVAKLERLTMNLSV